MTKIRKKEKVQTGEITEMSFLKNQNLKSNQKLQNSSGRCRLRSPHNPSLRVTPSNRSHKRKLPLDIMCPQKKPSLNKKTLLSNKSHQSRKPQKNPRELTATTSPILGRTQWSFPLITSTS